MRGANFEINPTSRVQIATMDRINGEMHPLITKDVAEALISKQIHTVLDFIKAEPQQVVKAARLNFREVLAVRNFLLKKFSAGPRNGFDCYRDTINNAAIIPTGIKGVDNLLDGGLFTGNIYEICGLPAAGKTQFALNVIKNVVQNTQQHVYVFDTKNDYSGAKIKSLLNEQKHQRNCLSRILVSRATTKYDLINGLYEVKKDLERGLKLRLIIIDSLPCTILNSIDRIENNASLNHLVNIMRYVAIEHHIVFLVVNLIVTWNENDGRDTVEKTLCGKYWSTVPNTRIKIEKVESSGMYKVVIQNSDTLVNKLNSGTDIRLSNEGFL